jgi:hypothetical protein
MTSILNTAIIRSPLLGQDKGVLFDDVEHGALFPLFECYLMRTHPINITVVGANNATINTTNPIKSIRVIYGEVVRR